MNAIEELVSMLKTKSKESVGIYNEFIDLNKDGQAILKKINNLIYDTNSLKQKVNSLAIRAEISRKELYKAENELAINLDDESDAYIADGILSLLESIISRLDTLKDLANLFASYKDVTEDIRSIKDSIYDNDFVSKIADEQVGTFFADDLESIEK